MQIRIGDEYQDWDEAKLERERPHGRAFQAAQARKDFDEAWLSQWAANATVQLHCLIADILEEPELTVEEPVHCGELARWIETQYGPLIRCRRCEFKVSARTYYNWQDGTGRRDLTGEGLTVEPRSYRKAIDMNLSGIYFVTRESNVPLGVTAGQMGLGR